MQTREDRNIAYGCVHLIAEKLLNAGVTGIVAVATYGRREPRQWLRSVADRTAAQVCAMASKVNPETAVARFRSRQPGHAAVDLTEDLVRRQAADNQYGATKIVDGTKHLEDSLAPAERYLLAGETIDLADWVSRSTPNA